MIAGLFSSLTARLIAGAVIAVVVSILVFKLFSFIATSLSLSYENEALKKSLAIAQSATDRAEKEAAAIKDESDKLGGLLDAYEKELAGRPNAACTLNDDDVKRLRSLR